MSTVKRRRYHRKPHKTTGDPSIPVASKAQLQPVITAFLIGAIPIVSAFVLQVLDEGGVDTPAWLRAALTGLGALVGGLAALWARSQVTPVADPKLDADTPLLPHVPSEAT
jgi:hypothetical protein